MKIQTLKAHAKNQGVNLNYDKTSGELDAWSQVGKVFAATDCHTIAYHFERGTTGLEDTFQEMADDICLGLRDCENEDCDICSEENQNE